MPIGKYFGGHGSSVMAAMKKKNGEEGGEREFYATANSRPGMKPGMSSGGDSAPMKPSMPMKPKKRMSFGQRIGMKDA